jgi:hypothetical protein
LIIQSQITTAVNHEIIGQLLFLEGSDTVVFVVDTDTTVSRNRFEEPGPSYGLLSDWPSGTSTEQVRFAGVAATQIENYRREAAVTLIPDGTDV